MGDSGPSPFQAGATAPYDIMADRERHLLHMVLRGTWDMLIFEQFAAAYIAAIEGLSVEGGVTHQLVDASAFAIQPAEIADRFPSLIEAAHYPAAQRTACVIPAIVNRVQARAGGDILNARYFRTIEDARSWLFGNEA